VSGYFSLYSTLTADYPVKISLHVGNLAFGYFGSLPNLRMNWAAQHCPAFEKERAY
jgi:hypothetical protein